MKHLHQSQLPPQLHHQHHRRHQTHQSVEIKEVIPSDQNFLISSKKSSSIQTKSIPIVNDDLMKKSDPKTIESIGKKMIENEKIAIVNDKESTSITQKQIVSNESNDRIIFHTATHPTSATLMPKKLPSESSFLPRMHTKIDDKFDVDAFLPPGYDKLMPPKQNGKFHLSFISPLSISSYIFGSNRIRYDTCLVSNFFFFLFYISCSL